MLRNPLKISNVDSIEFVPDGTVRVHTARGPLKPKIDKDGYECVTVRVDGVRKEIAVHRVVANFYCDGYEEGLQVNHKDGVKRHNHPDNLEWVTAKENVHHAFDTNLRNDTKAVVGYRESDGFGYYFPTTRAGNDLGFKHQSIGQAAKGKRKHSHGFTWEYYNA